MKITLFRQQIFQNLAEWTLLSENFIDTFEAAIEHLNQARHSEVANQRHLPLGFELVSNSKQVIWNSRANQFSILTDQPLSTLDLNLIQNCCRHFYNHLRTCPRVTVQGTIIPAQDSADHLYGAIQQLIAQQSRYNQQQSHTPSQVSLTLLEETRRLYEEDEYCASDLAYNLALGEAAQRSEHTRALIRARSALFQPEPNQRADTQSNQQCTIQ